MLWRLPVIGEAERVLTRRAGASGVALSSGTVVVSTEPPLGTTHGEGTRRAARPARTRRSPRCCTESPVRFWDHDLAEVRLLADDLDTGDAVDLTPEPAARSTRRRSCRRIDGRRELERAGMEPGATPAPNRSRFQQRRRIATCRRRAARVLRVACGVARRKVGRARARSNGRPVGRIDRRASVEGGSRPAACRPAPPRRRGLARRDHQACAGSMRTAPTPGRNVRLLNGCPSFASASSRSTFTLRCCVPAATRCRRAATCRWLAGHRQAPHASPPSPAPHVDGAWTQSVDLVHERAVRVAAPQQPVAVVVVPAVQRMAHGEPRRACPPSEGEADHRADNCRPSAAACSTVAGDRRGRAHTADAVSPVVSRSRTVVAARVTP